ncbi:MAG TPA: hypothetical protein VNQ73_05170 [Ilumatobacter sp.]|nr:hypothetical protein [Ilumatobacter sp.]
MTAVQPDAPSSGSARGVCPVDHSGIAAEPPMVRSPADRFMRRLLWLPADGPKASAGEARKAFQTSIMVAAVRCILMYLVFPFVLPAIGVATGVGPAIGLPISIVAIVCIVLSMRRFWRADHSKRWHYTALGTVVIGFLGYLIAGDIASLL